MTDQNISHGKTSLGFVPLLGDDVQQLLATGKVHPRLVIVSNAQLCDTFDVDEGSEEAELAASQVASVWALTHSGQRMVGVFRLVHNDHEPDQKSGEQGNGAVVIPTLDFSAMEAFFWSQDSSLDKRVAQSVTGLGIDQAWESKDVLGLLTDAPLLWHDVSELEAVSKELV